MNLRELSEQLTRQIEKHRFDIARKHGSSPVNPKNVSNIIALT